MRRQTALRILLVANTAFELIVAGASVFVLDQYVLAGNALALGTLSLLLVSSMDPRALRPGLIVLSVFHVAVTVAQIATSLQEGAFSPAVVVHGIFAASFLFFAWRQIVSGATVETG